MIKIRKFEIFDLPKIIEIEKLSFLKREAFSEDFFKKCQKEHPDGFFVAEKENEVVGYIIGRPIEKIGEIISLAVKPKERKKGIGKALIEFLLKKFKEIGIEKIFLHVRTKNKIAIYLYKKLNFKIQKEIKNYYKNGDSAYLMELDLNNFCARGGT